MKSRFFSCLGIIFLFIVIVGGGLFAYIAYHGSKLDASSKAYVDETVPIIVASWDKDELLKRASPELKKAVSDEEISNLFSTLKSKLGAFVKYDGAKGQSNMSYTSQGKVISATYKADAEFEHGKVVIDFKLIQHDGAWQILGFYVNLPLDVK